MATEKVMTAEQQELYEQHLNAVEPSNYDSTSTLTVLCLMVGSLIHVVLASYVPGVPVEVLNLTFCCFCVFLLVVVLCWTGNFVAIFRLSSDVVTLKESGTMPWIIRGVALKKVVSHISVYHQRYTTAGRATQVLFEYILSPLLWLLIVASYQPALGAVIVCAEVLSYFSYYAGRAYIRETFTLLSSDDIAFLTLSEEK